MMAYPQQIDRFPDKLDKKAGGGAYAVEERLTLKDGRFEGELAHDNIRNPSIRVYTGPRYTGEEITNFTVSYPDDRPWRRVIRIFSAVAEVYVCYETPGDTVEADDINALQLAVTATQQEIDRYKTSGVIDGGTFGKGG